LSAVRSLTISEWNADVNLFGPGNRANATIGRAVRLILRNVFQMIPGISDKSTQGHPHQSASPRAILPVTLMPREGAGQ
jgi:hypothetical protein